VHLKFWVKLIVAEKKICVQGNSSDEEMIPGVLCKPSDLLKKSSSVGILVFMSRAISHD
jgi:hypothetical protein